MEPATSALVGAGLATTGWLYTARRARSLSRKQHTVTVMLQASFNKEFREANELIRPYLLARILPDPIAPDERNALRMILNHYEFVAAGLRNGDFDERLVRDSQRSAILVLFETAKPMIWTLRTNRSRMSLYEHLEWLHRRWQERPPGRQQIFCEWLLARPFAGRRHDPHG